MKIQKKILEAEEALVNYQSLSYTDEAYVIKSFSNLRISQKKYSRFLKDLDVSEEGFHLATSRGNYVLVSVYSSLNVLFHEAGHQFLSTTLCCLLSDYKKIIELQGIFGEKNEEELLALEVFNDYFIFQELQLLTNAEKAMWPYKFYEESIYSDYFYLVEQFLNSFDYLMKYAMLNHMPKLIREVLGSENFDSYLALFSKSQKKEQSQSIKMECQFIIDAMKNHAKSYQVSYYDEVTSYLSLLEKSGKKVRVLKPSMEKLKEDERVIKSFQDSLY